MNRSVAGVPGQARDWRFPRSWGARTVIGVILAILVLLYTGKRVEMDRMLAMTGEAVIAATDPDRESQVGNGLGRVVSSLWPIQIEERREVSRIEDFDPAQLPLFSHLETVTTPVQTLNPETLEMETKLETREFLVEPVGYLWRIAVKMVETLEMALWGTLLAILISVPLAISSARPYSLHPVVYTATRAFVSLLRAIPELISALFLVLAYGFGPIAGVLALALHSAGFLAKFYAEDIENADPGPQQALLAIGTGRLLTLRHAVLPQVMPQYVAYTLYVLDRNVRMATVVGLVGAGGVGQELKGRFDMYDYGHVGTVLLAIFVVVLALDQISSHVRRQLFGAAV